MMKTQTEVYCTLQVEGTHSWKDCPFDQVSYLRDTHRHVFWIRAYKLVSHSNRDVEFIMLKHQIEKYISSAYHDDIDKLHVFGQMSCEMIGSELLARFNLSRVDVSEDNENGSVVVAKEVCCGGNCGC